jgi:ribosomal protein S18 acetylase RimI-like enzyme
MPEIAIRQADGAADVALVRALMVEYGDYLAHLGETSAGAASICIAGYEDELQGLPRPYAALLLAEVDGQAAGCVALKPMPKAPGAGRDLEIEQRDLEIKRLWVRQEFRGLSLGRRLMQAAIEHARQAGAAAIYLDTVPAAMPEANRLYAAMGFQQVERYNDNPVADVVFFQLKLDAESRSA